MTESERKRALAEIEKIEDLDEYSNYIVNNNINVLLESFDYNFSRIEKIDWILQVES